MLCMLLLHHRYIITQYMYMYKLAGRCASLLCSQVQVKEDNSLMTKLVVVFFWLSQRRTWKDSVWLLICLLIGIVFMTDLEQQNCTDSIFECLLFIIFMHQNYLLLILFFFYKFDSICGWQSTCLSSHCNSDCLIFTYIKSFVSNVTIFGAICFICSS